MITVEKIEAIIIQTAEIGGDLYGRLDNTEQIAKAIYDALPIDKIAKIEELEWELHEVLADHKREDFFKPKTDNICDRCHWMQFPISDKKIPCKKCRNYAG